MGTARPRGLGRPSSLRLAVQASRRALERAGVAPSEVDLLIYAGIYRDQNIIEPAIAPFVQRRLGMNLEPSELGRTLSFDLTNGTCGLLTGLQVADGYLRSGTLCRALVVASDVDSTPGISRGCDFDPSAGAVVVGASAGEAGFESFAFESFGKHSNLFEGSVDWIGDGRSALARRLQRNHALRIQVDEGYVEQCADCAAKTCERILEARGLGAGDVAVVPSWAPAGFPAALARRLAGALVLEPESHLRPHSAGPAFALEAALARAPARPLLLVAPGAGIGVASALYQLPGTGAASDASG